MTLSCIKVLVSWQQTLSELQRLMNSCRHLGEGPSYSTDANDSALLPDGVPLLDAPTSGPLLESIRSCCVLSPQGIVQGLAQVCVCAFEYLKYHLRILIPILYSGSTFVVCLGVSSII